MSGTQFYDHDYGAGIGEQTSATTAEYLNALFDEFGYTRRQYTLSKEFTSEEADRALQDAGLLDETRFGEFWNWWFNVGREYIVQCHEDTYRFDPEAF